VADGEPAREPLRSLPKTDPTYLINPFASQSLICHGIFFFVVGGGGGGDPAQLLFDVLGASTQ
jgi:hypothetical protein